MCMFVWLYSEFVLAVERYTGVTRDDRKGNMSMHSLQKKVRRLQQTITQKTGLRSKVNGCVCAYMHVVQ